MPCEEDKVKWWRQQSDNLPHWSSAVMKVLLVQPLNERTCVFAMLKTVRLEGGLYECSLKSKLIELSY